MNKMLIPAVAALAGGFIPGSSFTVRYEKRQTQEDADEQIARAAAKRKRKEAKRCVTAWGKS